MSDELKPCPFCMGKAREFIEATIPPGDKYAHCAGLHNPDVMCPNDAIMTVEQWNTRPVEDALRASLAAKDAEIERLQTWLDEAQSACKGLGQTADNFGARLNAATLKAKRQRCPDCHGVLPEYLCACGGIGCMECGYRNVKPCKCGVK